MFFKVIQNDNVVDVGFLFLRWDEKYNRFFICDDSVGQFALSSITEKIYFDMWMKPSSDDATGYESAKVVVIGQLEYDDLYNQLQEGEDIPINPEPEPEPDDTEPDPDESTPMTIAEMREFISEIAEQMSLLTECILEMSEVVYFG